MPPKVSARPIRRVAVLGAGVMGSRLAALCASQGLEVTLLDRRSDGPRPNRLAEDGVSGALKSRPPGFFLPTDAGRIHTGNFEDDLERLRAADWVLEAIVEDLAAKQALFTRIAPYVGAGACVTTNTSGLPVKALAAMLPAEMRSRFFGTHFFNPPRFLRLVETIPTADTDLAVMAGVAETLQRHLGKDLVHARDTPNFIANRIGTFALLTTLRLMRALDLSVEQVDLLTGPLMGWPKSATLRTLDLVGLDTLAHVVRNSQAMLPNDERREIYQVPDFIEEMIQRGWTGEKSGQGFYRREKSRGGEGQILALNLKTWEYAPRQSARFASTELAATMPSTGERLRHLVARSDVAGNFLWQSLRDLLLYSAARIPEIAEDGAEIDRAMQWGYNWEMGPFAIWDALGVGATAERMRQEGRDLPEYAQRLLERKNPAFYRWTAAGSAGPEAPARQEVFTAPAFDYAPVRTLPGALELEALRRSNREVRRTPTASLFDLGDGVGCFEFHGKMNAIGGDTIRLITESLADAALPFDAFVIGNEAEVFSAGADLLYLLLAMQNEDWEAIGEAVDAFQAMTTAVKRSWRPVVAAPAGMALGGGCEVVLHAAMAVSHVELYIGLVETGVGLIPAGGGCRQMAMRAAALTERMGADGRSGVESLQTYKAMFETIALGKVSGSAAEARKLGLLRAGDGIVANRHRLLRAARDQARQLADEGYAPPPAGTIPAPGPDVMSALELGVYLMREAEYISDFDQTIARHLLNVIGAGGAPAGQPISEDEMLRREREAFLSLCGEPKTQQRIQHMLKTGKPLRN